MAYSCEKRSVTRETLPHPPKDHLYLIGRKKRCRHAYCPTCGVQVVRRGLWKMRDWDYRRVRTVMVTVDRDLFPGGPEDALRALEKERSAFVRELNRRGAEVERFVWFCEWHEDGFPHYHFFLLVKHEGRAGQIGGDRIREAWRFGRYVHEKWVRDKAHWDAWVGYAAKTGYLHKDGKHQVVLPDWVKATSLRVRRTGSSQVGDDDQDDGAGPQDLAEWLHGFGATSTPSPGQQKPPAPPRTNREVLATCGSSTNLLGVVNVRGELEDYGEVDEPYRAFTDRPGLYVSGLGWAVLMHKDHFLKYYQEHHREVEAAGGPRPGRAPSERGRAAPPITQWAEEFAKANSRR